jgi:CheY-like chemotaxis protein
MSSNAHARVLLVDDDPSVAGMYVIGLEHAGLTVTTAGSGKAALAAIAHELPDVVVVDWNMPGMRGDQLLSILRGRPATLRLPVLFLSGFSPDEVLPRQRMTEIRSGWLMKTRTTPVQLARRVVAALGGGSAGAGPKAIA